MAVYPTQTLATQYLAPKWAGTKKEWKHNISPSGNRKKNEYILGHMQKP